MGVHTFLIWSGWRRSSNSLFWFHPLLGCLGIMNLLLRSIRMWCLVNWRFSWPWMALNGTKLGSLLIMVRIWCWFLMCLRSGDYVDNVGWWMGRGNDSRWDNGFMDELWRKRYQSFIRSWKRKYFSFFFESITQLEELAKLEEEIEQKAWDDELSVTHFFKKTGEFLYLRGKDWPSYEVL